MHLLSGHGAVSHRAAACTSGPYATSAMFDRHSAGMTWRGRAHREALLDDEDYGDQDDRGQPGLHRAVYPRDFGRQNLKDVERRADTVLA